MRGLVVEKNLSVGAVSTKAALPAIPTVRRNVGSSMRNAVESTSFAAPQSPMVASSRLRTIAGSSSSASTASSEASTINAAPVKAILFDMDGVLCNSEIVSRKAAAEVMKELYGLDVSPEEFIPYTGTGEANFLGGVARKFGAPFEVESCKAKFFEIYMAKYAVPGAGIGYKGARELVKACRAAGLKTAVASSADLVKVHANLGAADIPLDLFDAIVSADAFERLKPFPDIFLAAASQLGVAPESCVVIEDAVAGVEAARAAGMRVIGVVTTLAEDAMNAAGPDQVLPQISAITVDTLSGLKLREGGAEAIIAAKAKLADPSAASPSPTAPTTSSSNRGNSDGVQAWLNEYVSLPAGYRTTRRDALKFVTLGAAFASGYTAITRAKSLSYASPKALINALFPQTGPTAADAEAAGGRVAAFKRFIADLERRGGGQSIPDFPPGADWLNAPPLKLDRELKGKLVVLDFWTYCCINCMHILPDLAYLESKFEGQPVSVVGVHSAKFDNEQDTAAIRDAVLRYDIRHAVVNDRKMELWRALGVSSWPTVSVISPTGKLIVSLPGEGHREDLADILTAALEYYGEQGLLDGTPVPQALEKDKDPRLTASPLRFPGKLAVDSAGKRLFISDSGNHRILVTDLNGKFITEFGGNGPGLRDGDGTAAAFNRPQGLSYSETRNCLYVCDTENHAVREINLGTGKVRTVVGDGRKSDGDYAGGKLGSNQRLNSPWDCILLGDNDQVLLVAMAGQHQIWTVDLSTGVAAAVSGSGAERNQNGPSGAFSAWAQPSGLALLPSGSNETTPTAVLVADSESSTIRKLDLRTGGAAACVGGDPLFSDNLFKFGDVDGTGAGASLQHPLAVATNNNSTNLAYVADSYNHRLKMLNTETCTITTVAGSGQAGFKDGRGTAAQLSEPGGLAVGADGKVFIADTNNFLIRVFDPATSSVSTLQLKNVPKPRVSPDSAPAWTGGEDDGLPPAAAVVKASSPVAAGPGELNIRISLPSGYHLTQGANSRFECSAVSSTGSVEFAPTKGPLQESSDGTAVVAKIKYDATNAQAKSLRVLCTVYFCQDRSVCLFQEIVFAVDVAGNGTGDAVKNLDYRLSAQAPEVALPTGI